MRSNYMCGNMISRTIETVEVAGKTMFCEICVEDIEFHILGSTVKTNKWLRFEEWQQIYEQISKSFATYSSPPDFTIKSFTVGNYIRVEIELFPIQSCYVDLFKVKSENCLQDFLQIRIRQIALGSSLEEIQQAERNQEEIAAAIARRDKRDMRKNKKKRRANSISEYNPVTVKRNEKVKSAPLYKPSKLSPEIKEYDEPYSPKPVKTGEDNVDDYTPYAVSSSDKDSTTPTTVPTYKPSAIVKKTCENSSEEPAAQIENQENDENPENSSKDLPTRCEELMNSATPSPIFDSNKKNDAISEIKCKQVHITSINRNKRAKLSQDLFADSEGEYSKNQEGTTSDDGLKLSAKPSKRRRYDKDSDEMNSKQKTSSPFPTNQSKNGDAISDKDTSKALVGERRSARKATQKLQDNAEAYSCGSTHDQMTSSNPTIEKFNPKGKERELKSKKLSHLKSKCYLNQVNQESGLSKKEEACEQTFPMPSIEELQQNKVKYEKELELLENFSKDLKAKMNPPPNIETIDLNEMKVKELIGTFKEFKPKLDNLFEKFKKQKRFKSTPEAETLYLLILNIIDRNRVISMMDHLQSIYEPDCEGVPAYTDLFMNIMAPEWVLRIFMKKCSLNREKAIDRIKLQRDAEAFNQSQICTQ